jgi:3-oxoacyl-[acyl-carrier-protein] synthase II
MIGEASAALVLERSSMARARGAPILARLIQHSTSFCKRAIRYITDFTDEAIMSSMETATRQLRRVENKITFVVGCGNGHGPLMLAESNAVERVFGTDVSLINPKLTVGETFGSSQELAIAALLGSVSFLRGTQKLGLAVVNACQVGGGLSSVVLDLRVTS